MGQLRPGGCKGEVGGPISQISAKVRDAGTPITVKMFLPLLGARPIAWDGHSAKDIPRTHKVLRHLSDSDCSDLAILSHAQVIYDMAGSGG